MSEESRTSRAMIWKLIERGGSQTVSLIVQIVLARLLIPEDFGTLAVILVFINVGNVLVQSGLNMALVQAKNVRSSDYSGVFIVSLAIACVLYLCLFICAPAIEGFYGLDGVSNYLRVLGLLLLINSFNCVQIAYLVRNMLFSTLCKCTILSSIASGAGGILLAWFGVGLWSLIAQQLINQLTLSILLAFVVPWKPRMELELERMGTFFSFGWKVCVSNCVNVLYQNAYDLVIGKQFTASMLGYFSQGRKYPNALEAVFDEAIQSVMLPTLSRIQEDTKALKAALRNSLSIELCLIAPLMMGVAIFANEIVSFVLTEKWLPCVPFIQVFCIGYIFAPLSSNNLQALYAMGRSDIVLRLEFVKKTIGLTILGITAFAIRDMMIVAIGAVVYSIIVVAINGFPNYKLLDYKPVEQLIDYSVPLVSVILSALFALALGSFVQSGFLAPIVKGISFLASYMVLLGLMKPLGWIFFVRVSYKAKNRLLSK